MKDAEIDYSDIPALDKSFFTKAIEVWPPVKQQLTIRLDADVRTVMEGQSASRIRSTAAAAKKARSR